MYPWLTELLIMYPWLTELLIEIKFTLILHPNITIFIQSIHKFEINECKLRIQYIKIHANTGITKYRLNPLDTFNKIPQTILKYSI
jgi:hypothetical protein